EEAHGGVEGRAAPALERIEPGRAVRDGGGGGEHVVRAHARRHERLVGVAEGGVGDEQAFLRGRPLGEFFRAELEQQIARAGRRGGGGGAGRGGLRAGGEGRGRRDGREGLRGAPALG